jgi:hypothetical protein
VTSSVAAAIVAAVSDEAISRHRPKLFETYIIM